MSKHNHLTERKKSRKARYFYVVVFIVASVYIVFQAAMHWKIMPENADNLNYSVGIVGVEENKDFPMLKILTSAQLKDQITFGCGYSMQTTAKDNQCLTPELLDSIKGELAIVRWYELKGFFGHRNVYPQLASIEVDGKYIKSFNETRVLNEGYNNAKAVLTSLTILAFFVVLQLVLFGLRRKQVSAM